MKLNVSGFLSDITNFFHGGKVVGVDIGTSSIKAVQLSKKRDRLRLEGYGSIATKEYLEHPNQAFQSESLKLDENGAVYYLQTLLRESQISAKTALVSIPAFSSFVTVLDMPLLAGPETATAVQFQARQVIPLPPEQVSLDWSKIEEMENEKGQKFQKILLVGIPNEVVDLYKRILKGAGLRVQALELESLALLRAFTQSFQKTQGAVDNRPMLSVDIGALSTNVVVSEGGAMRYSGQSNHGGLYLTHALQESLGISMTRAENLKRRRGLLGKEGELELSTLLLTFLDVIIEEVRKIKDVYESRFAKKVEQVVLTGGGANLSGIHEYFGEQLGLPVSRTQVFLDVEYDPGLEPVMKNLSNEFGVAVGIARRYFS